jgi:transcriptional regulator with XRE-family HTH domain
VAAELADRGMSQKDLAEAVGVSEPAITGMLKDTKTCRFVEKIIEVLGVPEPEYMDARDAEVIADLRELRALDQAEYDVRAAGIRRAVAQRKKRR